MKKLLLMVACFVVLMDVCLAYRFGFINFATVIILGGISTVIASASAAMYVAEGMR